MRHKLLYCGAPKLLGEPVRSTGLHHSSILKTLCISMGVFADSGPIDSVLGEVGLAYEKSVSDRLIECGPVDYEVIPYKEATFDSGGELKVDGIFLTLDLVMTTPFFGPYSIKRTWISAANEPQSEKFTYFELQLMSECYALKVNRCWLDVTFEWGDYSKGNHRRYTRKIYEYEFTKDELKRHWAKILTEAESKHGWRRLK